MKRTCRLGAAAIVSAAFVISAGSLDPTAASAQGTASDAEKIRELQQRLDQRDAVIRNLMERVSRLEQERGEGAPVPAGGAPPGRPQARSAPAPAPPPRAAQAAPRTAPTPPPPPPQFAESAPAARPPSTAPAAAPAGPGQLEVSPEAAERALERALVQTGASLLPAGTAEFVPSVTYQYAEVSRPSQIALTTSGNVVSTEQVARNTQVEGAALFRIGLPWDAQAELRLPYDFKSRNNTTRLLGAGLTTTAADANGIGDLSLNLIKQVAREQDWVPNLFLSAGWDSDTGATDKGVSLGSGFNEFRVGLLASKRQDPLVFTSGFTYQTTLSNRGISPGDQFTPSVGMLFAVSPETSLQFSQQLSFVQAGRIQGIRVPGGEQLSGIFNVGVLSILAPGVVLNLAAGIGETRDAPSLTVQMAFPIRLN